MVFVVEQRDGCVVIDPPDGLLRPLSRAGAVRIDVFTIFPEWFAGPFDASLLGKARAAGRLDLRVHDLREHTTDRHRSVDDTPVRRGRGDGAWPRSRSSPRWRRPSRPRPLLLLSAAGRRFDHARAAELAAGDGLLAAVRPLRGRRPASRRPPLRRRAVGRRLRARRRGGGGRGRGRRGRPPGSRGDGQRRVGRRRVVRGRPARVPAVHPTGRLPGPRACPRCC